MQRLLRRALAKLRRGARLGGRAAGRGVVEFYNSENLTFAASIAYYSLLSLFPFLLIVLTILSRVAVERGGQTMLRVFEGAMPSQFEFLVKRVEELAAAPLELNVAGTVVMLWAAMGVFSAITSAINHAWGVEKPHGYFKHKLISFIMLVAAGVLMVAALFLVSAIEVAQARWFTVVIARYPGAAELTGFLYQNAPTPMFILVLGLIYYWVPNAQVRLRDVWMGAILAGLLWRLSFTVFSWYMRGFGGFNVHGSVRTIVIFLAWVYLSACIVLYGVEVTAAYARLRKHLPQQAPAAPVREE